MARLSRSDRRNTGFGYQVVVDHLVGRRPDSKHRQHVLAQQLLLFDQDGAEAPAEDRHQVGHRDELAQVAQATGGDRAVIPGDDAQRPSAEHAARGVDLGHGDLHAGLDGLRRGAVFQAELTVDAEQYRRTALRADPIRREQRCAERRHETPPAG